MEELAREAETLVREAAALQVELAGVVNVARGAAAGEAAAAAQVAQAAREEEAEASSRASFDAGTGAGAAPRSQPSTAAPGLQSLDVEASAEEVVTGPAHGAAASGQAGAGRGDAAVQLPGDAAELAASASARTDVTAQHTEPVSRYVEAAPAVAVPAEAAPEEAAHSVATESHAAPVAADESLPAVASVAASHALVAFMPAPLVVATGESPAQQAPAAAEAAEPAPSAGPLPPPPAAAHNNPIMAAAERQADALLRDAAAAADSDGSGALAAASLKHGPGLADGRSAAPQAVSGGPVRAASQARSEPLEPEPVAVDTGSESDDGAGELFFSAEALSGGFEAFQRRRTAMRGPSRSAQSDHGLPAHAEEPVTERSSEREAPSDPQPTPRKVAAEAVVAKPAPAPTTPPSPGMSAAEAGTLAATLRARLAEKELAKGRLAAAAAAVQEGAARAVAARDQLMRAQLDFENARCGRQGLLVRVAVPTHISLAPSCPCDASYSHHMCPRRRAASERAAAAFEARASVLRPLAAIADGFERAAATIRPHADGELEVRRVMWLRCWVGCIAPATRHPATGHLPQPLRCSSSSSVFLSGARHIPVLDRTSKPNHAAAGRGGGGQGRGSLRPKTA